MTDTADPDAPEPPANSEVGRSHIAESPSAPEPYAPMLDVHAPHETVHSWKDFFIHIATISVGLLIAIGLEQSVEYFHKRHERQQLEVDLQREGLRNREIVASDVAYCVADMAFALKAHEAIRATKAEQGQSSVRWPGRPLKDATGQSLRYTAPTAAVWNTAKESGAIALLPPEEARAYTRLYRYYDLFIQLDSAWRHAADIAFGVEDDFFKMGESPPNLASLDSAALNQVSSAVMQVYSATAELKGALTAFRQANDAVLGGVRTDEEIIEAVYREQPISSSPKWQKHASYKLSLANGTNGCRPAIGRSSPDASPQ
jgi:hypothetical protein